MTSIDRSWVIWSNQHKCWWAPDELGYVDCDEGQRTAPPRAGRYTTEEALVICSKRSLMPGNIPPEVMVPSPEFLERFKASELVLCQSESSYSRDYPY